MEWIEYDQFENIEHLTEGGCTTIYTAIWKDGYYAKWDLENIICLLFQKYNNNCDLELSELVDKPPNSFYGNLSYIAPEVHCVNECRPKIYKYIPYEYATLIKQCWDANPDNRPSAYTIKEKMKLLIRSFYNEDKQQELIIQSNKSIKDKNNHAIKNTQLSKNTEYRIQNRKVYTFNIPIKLRNATDAFDSKQIDFEISEEMEK
ncbi:hypothetical protein Glove_136g69 [Diversispora epigaea]|uniref:Serine-threonine/tyrosine-protein kinase catalytic domain-containing protein n=1 Tax=Diversispora epigaea TaxID=1348612 RepID=A0A397J0I1_9GLOM|nr:hypothetical protein Glove_136g69 [Diversispora epigaea]